MENRPTLRSRKLPRLHGQTLIEMNLAAFTGRRDAALDRVRRILRRELVASSKERRTRLYTRCILLLDEAIMATRRSQVDQDTPLLHYLRLLRDSVSANLALIRHELTMATEQRLLAELATPEIAAGLRQASDLFSQSEMNLMDCTEELLRFGTAVRKQDTQGRAQAFTDEDRRRYDLALAEYRKCYQTLVTEEGDV
jgi:hypothetical protein